MNRLTNGLGTGSVAGSQRAEKIELLGVMVDNVTFQQAVDRVLGFLRRPRADGGHPIITLNPEMVMSALDVPSKDQTGGLQRALQEASMVVADGIGIVWASRLLGVPLPERIPGIDLAEAVLAAAAQEGWSVFFVGARPGVARVAAERLANKYTGLRVVGVEHGFFSDAETERVVQRVADAEADLVLVGMGSPRQEEWINAHRHRLGAKVMIGVGGAFDVFSGQTRRAPVALQRLGLEWAYRLAKEPRRLVRATALPRFVVRVLWERWRKG